MPRFPVIGVSYLLLSSLSFFASDAVAQNTLKDSKELIDKGLKLYAEGKYKDALTYYLQVPEGDTNYNVAKYETVLTYLADSSFERSKQAAFEALKLEDGNRRQLLYLAAHAYDYLGKTDSAIYYYDSLAKAYPADNFAHYEKAVVYYHKKDFDKAIPLLEKALMMKPHHYRSHAVLGNIYMQQGRLAEAYMACMAALLFTEDMDVARGSILTLSAIAKQSKEVSDYYEQRKEGFELYSETDEIIHARLPLNSKYVVPSVMGDDQIIKVAYAVMEKLSYDKNEKNFAMQYYVPLFRAVFEKGMFDPFILLLFSNYEIESVDKYAKKQKRDISEVRDVVNKYWDRVLSTRVLEYHKRESAPMLYSFDQSSGLYVVGNMATENGKVVFKDGYSKIYENGLLVAEGRFNNNNEKDGPWRYYHTNGKLRLTETYKNGEIDGEAREYRSNGFLSEVRKYNLGKQTEEHEYTYNGILDNSTIRKEGKDDIMTSYHPDGRKNAELRLKDGELVDGKHKWYYENGKLMKEVEIADGKRNGEYKEYHENGVLRAQGTFKKGEREGLYTVYYENGKKESELSYSNGKPHGEYTAYTERGQITDRTMYSNGKRNGPDISYSDGKEYCVVDYKNDKITGYSFKGKDGKEIKETIKETALLKVHYANGNVRSELPLKDGLVNGQAKYYFNTGGLREKVDFVEDVKNGTSTEYYKNGKVQMVSEYVKGERTGQYKGYYTNGQLQAEGWLINDKKEGIWRFYNIAGKLERESFFRDDEANGPSKHYDGAGRILYKDYYDNGLIMRMEQYNAAGKMIHEQTFPLGTGKYYFIYPNGNPSFEAMLKNGNYEGAFTSYYPDKSVKEKGFYKNGVQDSLSVSYFPGGQESIKGYYVKGQKDGMWITYRIDGKLIREVNYRKGNEHGKDNIYIYGELRHEYNMENDYMDGNQIFYGEGNKIALVYDYKERELTGYTYEGQDGKLVPIIPMKNGTGKVTTYYPNGKKAVELNMVQNTYDGKMTIYFSDGSIADEKIYANTELNGVFKRFYQNGKPYYESTYKDGVLNGEEKIYADNGKLLINANYLMGDEHGQQMYYNPKTGKGYKLMFEYGKLLTMENL